MIPGFTNPFDFPFVVSRNNQGPFSCAALFISIVYFNGFSRKGGRESIH
jgi:hypothetical protein